MEEQNNRARYEYWIVKFYNEIAGTDLTSVEDVPAEALEFLGFLDYETIIEPFLARDLLSGYSRDIGPIRYGVSEGLARSIGQKYKAFPRKK